MKEASGLIINARTSAAACISSVQSEPASRRSPARVPVRVTSVSSQPAPAPRRTVTSADSGSAGGGTLPATRRTSLFTASIPGHSSGAFHEIAIGSSSGVGAGGAMGVTVGPGSSGAGGAGAVVPPAGASPAPTTRRASNAGS